MGRGRISSFYSPFTPPKIIEETAFWGGFLWVANDPAHVKLLTAP